MVKEPGNLPVISGFGHSFPPSVEQTEMWDGFFKSHYGNSAIARRLFRNVGVERRHAVANPIIDDVSQWSTGDRMRRYITEAMPLAKSAVIDALAAARVKPEDVGMFVVASCTGYVSPGLDTFIARDLGMNNSLQRTVIGHMGCFAALPGMSTASDYVVARNKPAVLLCLELTSLHVQPPTTDVEQMVAHALFSDGASAVVIQPGSPGSNVNGLEVVDVAAITDTAESDLMTWTVTDLGFRMVLSQKVPDVLSRHVRPLVDELLMRNEVTHQQVRGWAAHPGGPRILDVITEQLELSSTELDPSRAVLAEHGNCSSPTVLMVMDEIVRRGTMNNGDYMVALAFGPGLTLYSVLLRAC